MAINYDAHAQVVVTDTVPQDAVLFLENCRNYRVISLQGTLYSSRTYGQFKVLVVTTDQLRAYEEALKPLNEAIDQYNTWKAGIRANQERLLARERAHEGRIDADYLRRCREAGLNPDFR